MIRLGQSLGLYHWISCVVHRFYVNFMDGKLYVPDYHFLRFSIDRVSREKMVEIRDHYNYFRALAGSCF